MNDPGDARAASAGKLGERSHPPSATEPLSDSPRSRMWQMAGVPYYFPFCRGAPHTERDHNQHPRGWTCDCPCHGGENNRWWSELKLMPNA